MISRLFTLSLGIALISNSAMAVLPFTISGNAIKQIFTSPLVTKKLGGHVQDIRFVSYRDNVSTYWVTTIETTPCLAVIEITNTTPEELNPIWNITKVDLKACPGSLPIQ